MSNYPVSTVTREATKVKLSDCYTDDVFKVRWTDRFSTVTVTVGAEGQVKKLFQCTATDWKLMCMSYLDETQAPGVPGHNTQQEDER